MAKFVANDAAGKWTLENKKPEIKSVKMFKQGTVLSLIHI